jgi:hypothetical protein
VRKAEAERDAALEAADQARKAAEAAKVSLAKAAVEPPTKGTGAPKVADERVPRAAKSEGGGKKCALEFQGKIKVSEVCK